MSSGGTIPPFATQSFNPSAAASLSHLFPNTPSPFSIPCLTSQNNSHRIKVKRCRQRVDAGEPRNSYQSQMKNSAFKKESSVPLTNGVATTQNVENGYDFSKYTISLDNHHPEDEAEALDVESALNSSSDSANAVDSFEDAFISNTMFSDSNDINAGEYARPGDMNQEEEVSLVLDMSENGQSNSSARRKGVQPQRQVVENGGNFESGDEGNDKGEEEENELESTHEETEELFDEKGDTEEFEATNEPNDELECDIKETNKTQSSDTESNFGLHSQLAATLAASGLQNGNVNKFQEIFEAQRRLYANWLELQKKQFATPNRFPENFSLQDKGRAFTQLQQGHQQEIQRDFSKFTQTLKDELSNSLSGSIDKVVSEFLATEIAANTARIMAAAAITAQQQQQFFAEQQHARAAATAFMMPNATSALYNPTPNLPAYSTASPLTNLFAAAAAAQNSNALHASTSGQTGIFPTAQYHAGFGPFSTPNSMFSASMSNLRNADLLSPPRKKRSKVTDSVRVKLNPIRDSGNSLPASARSSPSLSSYFPPTMVNHPLYNGSSFGTDDRDESPVNSDDFSDCGPYDSSYPQSVTLTPVHLRKAKLMFFFTRYPSSSLLKSFFPDIRFNKHNTAQLVKWFSNFREFFYMQMEKYAKQAIAEGIKHRDEIVVTTDSEIYKQLNQHYNRNNLFQPPERLHCVIQETLKEFFVALQNGRDAEPSWKKAIYKVISRMDDPIPEYFKDPSFMSTLE
uniref:Prospero domain-containing protein n=1 Tax=Acrobeloides nanus TaxID=290746 RepID=A0A914E2G6_9BILA